MSTIRRTAIRSRSIKCRANSRYLEVRQSLTSTPTCINTVPAQPVSINAMFTSVRALSSIVLVPVLTRMCIFISASSTACLKRVSQIVEAIKTPMPTSSFTRPASSLDEAKRNRGFINSEYLDFTTLHRGYLLLFFSRSGSNAGRHHGFLYTRRKNSDVTRYKNQGA